MPEQFVFRDLRDLLAKANEEKSGDQLAGIAARSERERVAAKRKLADLSLEEIVRQPLIALFLFVLAIVNLFTKETATIWGLGFSLVIFGVFEFSEKYNRRKTLHVSPEIEKFRLDTPPEVSMASVNARPGNVLVTVHNPNQLDHVKQVLEKTNTVKKRLTSRITNLMGPKITRAPVPREVVERTSHDQGVPAIRRGAVRPGSQSRRSVSVLATFEARGRALRPGRRRAARARAVPRRRLEQLVRHAADDGEEHLARLS